MGKWEEVELKKIIGFKNGFAFKSKLFKVFGLPIVRISNLQDGLISEKNIIYFNPEDYGKDFSSYEIKKGDLLIAMSGATTGKISINQNDKIYYLNQRVGKFIIANETLKKYITFFLETKIEEHLSKAVGAAIPNLSSGDIMSLKIPFPPLPEQERIVAKLDGLFEKIDQAISLLEENIAHTEALMGSVLDEEFGKLKLDFENIALDQVLKIKSGGFLSSKKMSNTNEYNVYGGNGINGTHNIFNLEDENIVIGRVGAKCGNVRLVKGTIWVTDNAFYVSEIKKDISKEFLLETLRLLNLGETANQAAQPVISFKGIRNLTMPIPDRENQKSFCVKSQTLREKTNLIIGSQTQKLNHLKALKSSLLDRAFKGEL